MDMDSVIAAIEMNEKRLKVLVGQRDRVQEQIVIVEGSLNIFRQQLGQAQLPAVGSNVKDKK